MIPKIRTGRSSYKFRKREGGTEKGMRGRKEYARQLLGIDSTTEGGMKKKTVETKDCTNA